MINSSILFEDRDDAGENILIGGMGGRLAGAGLALANAKKLSEHPLFKGSGESKAALALLGAEAGGIGGELGGYLWSKYKKHHKKIGHSKAAILIANEAEKMGHPDVASKLISASKVQSKFK